MGERSAWCTDRQPSALQSLSGCCCSSSNVGERAFLPGMCSQQPGCVGLPGAWGRGSRMGSTAQATQYRRGRVKMAHRKLGLSPVSEEEDLEAPLNSVLPCFLAS